MEKLANSYENTPDIPDETRVYLKEALVTVSTTGGTKHSFRAYQNCYSSDPRLHRGNGTLFNSKVEPYWTGNTWECIGHFFDNSVRVDETSISFFSTTGCIVSIFTNQIVAIERETWNYKIKHYVAECGEFKCVTDASEMRGFLIFKKEVKYEKEEIIRRRVWVFSHEEILNKPL